MSFPCRDEGKLAAVMWNFENFNLCDEIAFSYVPAFAEASQRRSCSSLASNVCLCLAISPSSLSPHSLQACCLSPLTAAAPRRAELRGDVRGEWDELKQHDVVFLVTVRPPDEVALAGLRDSGAEPTPADLYGLVYVRGAEVVEVRARRWSAARTHSDAVAAGVLEPLCSLTEASRSRFLVHGAYLGFRSSRACVFSMWCVTPARSANFCTVTKPFPPVRVYR